MTAPQRIYITTWRCTSSAMFDIPILFRFVLLAFVGASVVSVANSKNDFALLAGTFLIGLGALEAVLVFFGV